MIGVDSIADDGGLHRQVPHRHTQMTCAHPAGKRWTGLAEVVDRGAGEVVLNCMSADGTRAGYDLEQLSAAEASLPIPLVASGGAGTVEHFVIRYSSRQTSMPHWPPRYFIPARFPFPQLKQSLAEAGIEVRPC